jgi:uncharacterized membrane protein YdjX (TVP38/TMEM64 family)
MEISRKQAAIAIAVVIVALGFLVLVDLLVERYSPWDYGDFADWADGWGVFGPIAYIAFYAVSMVLAPIPTSPAPVAAATAFGGVVAFFYTLLGATIGGAICFWIARRWGRPLMRHFLPERFVNDVDRLAERLGVRVLFVLRLFPLLGTDAVSYGAGLTPIRFVVYLVITVVGSTPMFLLLSLVGDSLREDRIVALISIAGLGVFLVLPLIYMGWRGRRSAEELSSMLTLASEPGGSEVTTDTQSGPT